MKRVISMLLIVVGVVNLLPVAGVLSAGLLASAYGIPYPDGDLLILLRHRALLFGIVGAIIITSAFRRHLQLTAIVAGLVSMLGFVALAFLAGDYGAKLESIIIIDVAASIGLIVVALLRHRQSNGA